ncbi:MAG: group I intron-associated PD-(D/E)XK endonuclease [Chitinophagales bacterium]
MNSNKFNLYLGQAGQLFAMSEFLARGWNVAVPEVDVGDDMFVVRDKDGIFQRVQVKTGTGKIKSKSFSTQFSLNFSQLVTPISPELYYCPCPIIT